MNINHPIPPSTWDTVVAALEAWRKELEETETPADSGSGTSTNVAEPAVSTVAEHYKRDPWAILVSTIISLRTKDAVTLTVSQGLLQKAPDPASLAALPDEILIRLVYPAGFYRTKAANLKKIAVILREQYQYQVPATMEELLALPGVGRKTANLVLTEAFDQDGICVDIHVHRISNRLGWVSSANPEQTETALRAVLPRQYWKGINALLVLYGQRICRPISPFCSRCVIHPYCERRGVIRSR
ncbi:MAG: endonuclease III [Treponema sp.]|jgi:endonuclease-3|nr:endonuclease III [Treponema sp.]